jgi:ATP-dependent Clp protease adaptor protein ClpS
MSSEVLERKRKDKATDPQGDILVAERGSVSTAKPKLFKVLLLNDDYTSMDFVVAVLEGIFRRSPAEAVEIMLSVHKRGSGVAGVYPKEIAEAKIENVHSKARNAGYPLRCQMQEE